MATVIRIKDFLICQDAGTTLSANWRRAWSQVGEHPEQKSPVFFQLSDYRWTESFTKKDKSFYYL